MEHPVRVLIILQCLALAVLSWGEAHLVCPQSSMMKSGQVKMYEGSCFYFDKTRIEHDSAGTFCRRIGGTLVMLKSSNVNHFIKKNLQRNVREGQYFWIGLTNKQKQNVYRWADGTKLAFSNFDGLQGSKHPWSPHVDGCVVVNMWNGKWRDKPCYDYSWWAKKKYPFICEYSAVEEGIQTHRPTTSTPRPTTSTPRPTTSTHKPTTSTHRSTTPTHRPTTSTHRPTTSTPRPTTSTHRTTTSTHRPTTSTPRPTTSTHRTTTSTHRLTTSTHRLTTSTHRPTPSTHRPTTSATTAPSTFPTSITTKSEPTTSSAAAMVTTTIAATAASTTTTASNPPPDPILSTTPPPTTTTSTPSTTKPSIHVLFPRIIKPTYKVISVVDFGGK